jgi:hypothetical protein
MALVPKTNEQLSGMNFMFSEITEHKNEDSSLLGCSVALTGK